jgi:hypothetical protein
LNTEDKFLFRVLIYFLIFAVLTAFSFLEVNLQRPVEYRIIYYMVAVFLILMAGLRYDTGYDIHVYKLLFDYVTNITAYKESLLEPGSFLIITIFHALNLNFQAYIFLYATIAVLLKTKVFAKYAAYIFIAMLVYFPIGFMINEMGQIRHGLAIGIVLVAFSYLFQNRVALFFLFCTIAIFFHISAFMVLPVYLLVNRNFKASWLLLSLVALSVLLFFDARPIFLSLLDLVPIASIHGKATLYLYSEEFGKPLGFNISYILRVVIFWVLIYFRDTGNARFSFYDKLIWLYCYGIVLYIIFNSVAEFAIRTTTYFKTLDCLILPYIIGFGKTRVEKNLIWGLVVLYAFYSMYKLLYDPVTRPSFIPYRSILNT